MLELSLEGLRKLRDDSARLNAEIEQINILLDGCQEGMEGMADVSGRMSRVFALYRELVSELRHRD